MKRYGFVFARGGSKGVPGKNIRMLAGKPLLAHAIECGRATGLLDDIIVSTDSEEIAAVARQYGARTPFMRPAEIAQDTSPEALAWWHALEWLDAHNETFDVFVSLPATAPLRTPEDVSLCIHEFEKGGCDILITCQPASRHPMFNMYRVEEDGTAHLWQKPEKAIFRRQDAPPAFDGSTMAYVTTPEFIKRKIPMWEGKVRALTFPRERAVDIDDEVDFRFAEMLLNERKAKSCAV